MRKLLLWLARCLPVFFALTLSVRATDVIIASSVVPGFNAANLPPDVNLTGVSVVSGSPIVTCPAQCFRSQWVGLGGFRIVINGVPYTVKFVSSRSALTLATNYAASDNPNSSVLWYKYVELRIYADSAFQPAGKDYIIQPGAPGSGAWHRRIAASVVNELGINNLYIPELTLDATTDSLTNQTARYFAGFYRPEGSFIQSYQCFESFALGPDGATSWPAICMFNSRFLPSVDTRTYTATQIDSFRTGCTVGQGLFYAATGLKPSCLIFGSGLSLAGDTLTATAPSGYTTVLNNGAPLTQRNNLNFVSPALIASDNGGGVRTDVTVHGNLLSLANLASNGAIFRTAANTLTPRTHTGTTNRIVITDGDGVLGNPTYDIGSTVATSGSTLNFFAATTSAQLAGVISDESGSGALIFGTSPALTTPTITSPRIVTAINDSNGNALFNLTATASAVNQFTAANAATGNGPTLSATGANANIDINLTPKGTGVAAVGNGLRINSTVPRIFLNDTDNSKAMEIAFDNTVWNFNNSTLATTPLSMNTATDVFTFSQIPVLPASNPTTANQAVRKQTLDDSQTFFSLTFRIDDPSTAATSDQSIVPMWVVPAGNAVTITKLKVIYASGSHTVGGSVTFTLIKNAVSTGQFVTLDNTNNTPFTVYTADISDIPVSSNDTITWTISARTPTVSERAVSLIVEGFQKVKTP